jgi:hypothetical protein
MRGNNGSLISQSTSELRGRQVCECETITHPKRGLPYHTSHFEVERSTAERICFKYIRVHGLF